MLVWINGPFGGGKTQTAHELARRLPGSVICDPERVGFGLHRMMPAELRGDFQDLPAWRRGVVEVLDLVLTRRPGTVVVPMTVVDPTYFAETVGWLREQGHDVRHVALLARRETVLRRLREREIGRVLHLLTRPEVPLRRETFAVSRLDVCLERLAAPEFAEHLRTDDLTVAQVVDRVAASAGLVLSPDTDSAWRGRLRRTAVGLAHVRWR